MKWIIIILIAILLLCITRILRMKHDIKTMNNSLKHVKENDTNSLLTTTTFYKDICNLSITMNEILEKQKQIRIAGENSNREFRQAITNISHDLKTPLTSAIGYIQMIQSDGMSEEKKIEYLRIIEYRLKSLSNLTNELLEYSKIIEGKIQMNYNQINISNLLCDSISSFYDQLIQHDYKVRINIPDEALFCMGDSASFERIFTNLIQNALRFGTEIFDISLDRRKKIIVFSNKIADTHKFDVEQLFDRFYIADKSRNSKSTGLGLAIVKELVTSMGGTIRSFIEEDFLIIEIKLAKMHLLNLS